jgi:ABC-type transport system involved in multi-copper enzyme maturation permease subunit
MTTPSRNDSMRWLLWKDYRANRPVLWAGLFLLLLPYAIAIVGILWRWEPRDHTAGMFLAAGVYSIVLVQLVFAVFGGNAIAGERADRSAEFLAALPVSRGRKLTSKLWLGLGLWLTAWLPNLLALGAIWYSLSERAPPLPSGDVWAMPVATAVTGVTFFCVAWMLSAMLESPTFAAGAGLVTPLLVGMCFVWSEDLLRYLGAHSLVYRLLGTRDYGPGPLVYFGYVGTCVLISILCFTIGTRYYLRRVEP